MAISDLYLAYRLEPASQLPYQSMSYFMSKHLWTSLAKDKVLSGIFRSVYEAIKQLKNKGINIVENKYGSWEQIHKNQLPYVFSSLTNVLEERGLPVSNFLYAHQVDLPFYNNTKLLNIGVEAPSGKQGYYSALLQGKDFVLLDGQSKTIYDFNARHVYDFNARHGIHLDNAGQAASYLRFFTDNISGAKGEPFPTVESVTDLPWSYTVTKEYIVSLHQYIPAMSVAEYEDSEGWRIQIGISHQNNFFTAQFLVEKNGVVAMLSNHALTNPLPVGRVSVENGLWLTDYVCEW
ncbi:MAG: hypothetical protein R3215_00040 [Halomonas sp.]|nr:hypothetical protein [Halomonas sp.]